MISRFSQLDLVDPSREDSLLPMRNSVGDDVYEALLTLLITLKIAPGERMSVDALVRDFGVSQTPIRAALIRLETEGLVVRKHNAGYSAAPIPSGAGFRDMFEFRIVVEPKAAALAAQRMGETQRKDLIEIAAAMQNCLSDEAGPSYGRFAIQDARFHELIAEGCGNEVIVESLGRIYAHLHLFRLGHQTAVSVAAVDEHLQICEAIATGNIAGAETAMLAHIETSRARLEPIFRARR